MLFMSTTNRTNSGINTCIFCKRSTIGPLMSLQDILLLRYVLNFSLLLLMRSQSLSKLHPHPTSKKEQNKASSFVQIMAKIHDKVHGILQQTLAKYKALHDQHRVSPHFQVNWVWLCYRPKLHLSYKSLITGAILEGNQEGCPLSPQWFFISL